MVKEIVKKIEAGVPPKDISRSLGVPIPVILGVSRRIKNAVVDIPFDWEFGVEIEISKSQYDKDHTPQYFTKELGLPCKSLSYGGYEPGIWMLKSDSSIDSRGFEIVTPHLKGQQGLDDLKRVMRFFVKHETYTSVRCGIHVHIWPGWDGASKQWGFVFESYRKHQSAIDKIMPPSRIGNTYSGPLKPRDHSVLNIAEILSLYGSARYLNVNPQSYRKCKSVEFRQFGVTTDFNEINGWVRFLGLIMDHAQKNELLPEIPKTGIIGEFFERRMNLYQT